jgi:hypothetical protein
MVVRDFPLLSPSSLPPVEDPSRAEDSITNFLYIQKYNPAISQVNANSIISHLSFLQFKIYQPILQTPHLGSHQQFDNRNLIMVTRNEHGKVVKVLVINPNSSVALTAGLEHMIDDLGYSEVCTSFTTIGIDGLSDISTPARTRYLHEHSPQARANTPRLP